MRYLALIIVIFFLWFFAGSFVNDVKNDSVSSLHKIILWPQLWVKGLISPALTQQQQKELQLENKNLKAHLWQLEKTRPSTNSNIVSAKIHSRYPFNDKSIISINVGKQAGINIDMITTSEIRITCIIEKESISEAAQALHRAFELGDTN